MEYCLCWHVEWLAHFIDSYLLWKIVSFVENDLEHFELTYFLGVILVFFKQDNISTIVLTVCKRSYNSGWYLLWCLDNLIYTPLY